MKMEAILCSFDGINLRENVCSVVVGAYEPVVVKPRWLIYESPTLGLDFKGSAEK